MAGPHHRGRCPSIKLAYSVDDQPWRFVFLGAKNATAASPILQLRLAVPPPSTTHEHYITQHDLVVKVWASSQMCDRWNGGAGRQGAGQHPAHNAGSGLGGAGGGRAAGGVGTEAPGTGAVDALGASAPKVGAGPCSSYLEIAGASLDPGGSTARPSTLQPRRMLFYGDSITEGTNAHYYDYYTGACHAAGGEMVVNAAQASWGSVLADALKCEPSQTAFAGTGYVTRSSYTYGNVPPLFFPGNASGSAWDKVDSGHSRLQELRDSPPHYVFSAHGNNDQVCAGAPKNPCTMADLRASVKGWIGAMRAATSPATRIVVVVPFGGTFSGHNSTRDAIRGGFVDYQLSYKRSADNESRDPQAYMVDLYPNAPQGINGQGASVNSCFGVHPIADAHARLASMVGLDLAAQGGVLPPPTS